jgi:hypothetical protein
LVDLFPETCKGKVTLVKWKKVRIPATLLSGAPNR